MSIFDKIVLLATGLIAIYMIYFFIKKRQSSEETCCKCDCNCVWYFITSFAVLLVAGLLLIVFGWDALSHPFMAVVAGLIPFGLAIGLVCKIYPGNENKLAIVLLIGLILITIYKFVVPEATWGKIVYPIFHAIAGLTIFFVPIFAVKDGKKNGPFVMISVGGTLIGLGGIALAFITAGKQLLFFSHDFVLLILAPLLFFTALFFALGFIKGNSKTS